MDVIWRWLPIILQLIFLEGILSLDNAAVLGAMVSPLPADEGDVKPPAVRPLIRHLGGQRHAALKVGLLGAYVGRGAMLFLASLVIANPWLRIVGALYLMRLAVKELSVHGDSDDKHLLLRGQRGFWHTVLAVELADLAFSLDNVVAAVALSSDLIVVMIGVALGILTMRFAASAFVYFIERWPALAKAAFVLILVIGIELLVEEFFGWKIGDLVKFAISLSILLAAILYEQLAPAWLHAQLRAVGRLFARLDHALRLFAYPVALVFNLFSTWLSS